MVTIVIPISRTEYLKPVFDCLDKLERPSDTELVIITDGDKELGQAVDRRLDSISYSVIQVVEFGEAPAQTINERRHRISAIHNKAKQYVSEDAEYVFLIEDDTTYPQDVLTNWLGVGFDYVEGVELGRHQTPYIGAWTTNGIKNPVQFESVMPSDMMLQPIDAGGLYCCLVNAEFYRNHTFEPFDLEGTNGLSCDVNLGVKMRQAGYDCYLDWSVLCDHIGDKGSVNLGNTKPCQVRFEKGRHGKWSSRRV